MLRTIVTGVAVVAVCLSSRTSGQTMLEAHLHKVPTAHSLGDEEGMVHLELSADQKQLHYMFEFHGLDLEPIAANRTDDNDIVGIHLHEIILGQIGIHVLNVFGIPGEDDGDLVVDYENETLSGIFDITDASRDPATGNLLPQFAQLTTKIIDDWVDNLLANGLYFAVHTTGEGGGPLLHGDVVVIPEPQGTMLISMGLVLLAGRVLVGRRTRRAN